MKAIISSTYDNNYLYFLPIVTWCWNKLGVDVICFMPYLQTADENKKIDLINDTFRYLGIKPKYAGFAAPEHKQATYAQCARLYGGCLDLPDNEKLITSDVDMAVFRLPQPYMGSFHVWGFDLVPERQYPICYIAGYAESWRKAFGVKTYQESLDSLLGEIEAEHFRGNYWGKDQEEAWNKIHDENTVILEPRARPQTQFAMNRVDRDDAYWRERLNPDLVDAHLWRPGYTDEAHANIKELLQYMYPIDDFGWLDEYRNKYLTLL